MNLVILVGFPSTVAGWNLILCAAIIACSVKPSGKLATDETLPIFPEAKKVTRNLTAPCVKFWRAADV